MTTKEQFDHFMDVIKEHGGAALERRDLGTLIDVHASIRQMCFVIEEDIKTLQSEEQQKHD